MKYGVEICTACAPKNYISWGCQEDGQIIVNAKNEVDAQRKVQRILKQRRLYNDGNR